MLLRQTRDQFESTTASICKFLCPIMTARMLIIIFLIINQTSAGINRYEYVNSKTNQYIRFTGSSGRQWTFSLVTKKASCILTNIIITSNHLNFFIDSLKKVGFKESNKKLEVTQEYSIKLSIDTCHFSKTIEGDSLFKFVYKYEVTDKNNVVFKQFQTQFVTERQKAIDSIRDKKFEFRAGKILGTTIVHISITSLNIYNLNKKAQFQSGTTYGFFL